MDPLGALFEHHAWATVRLIDHCLALPPARLRESVPGTYGTIERTLVHLVAADQRCHKPVHELGWGVSGNANGQLDFTRPDGRVLTTGPPGVRPDVRRGPQQRHRPGELNTHV